MESPTIIFRTEGGFKTGLGHVKRCLRLAGFLERCFHSEIIFILSPSDISLENLFRGKSYETCFSDAGKEESLLESMCEKKSPQVWITDVRTTENKSLIQNLAGKFEFLHILIDDMHLAGIEAEVTMNPSILPCNPSAHPNRNGKFYCGPEFFFHIPVACPPKVPRKNGKRILISMGGSDPDKVTEKLLNSFAGKGEEIEIHFAVGPAFVGQSFPKENRNIFPHHSPENLEALISLADLVITSAGLTLYETVRLGVPVVSIPQNQYESKTADAFQERGVALNMKSGGLMDSDHVVSVALSLLKDCGHLQKMSMAGKGMIPGKGAEVIRETIRMSLTNMQNWPKISAT